MADTKISALTALTGAGVAPATDLLPIVDTSAVTTKSISVAELMLTTTPITGTTITATQGITTGEAAGTNGSVAFKGSTSGTVTVQPAVAAGTWSLTLPTSAGTNGYVLSTNGSGVTSWIAGGGFDPASPGPIGGTTPAAITGTTITATTQLVGAKVSESVTAGAGWTITAGTAASAVSAETITQTWNYNAAAITGVKWTFTDTSSHANTLAFQILGGAAGTTNLFNVSKAGALIIGNSGSQTVLAPGTYNGEMSIASSVWYVNPNDVALLTKAAATIGWSSSATVDGNQHHGDTALSRYAAASVCVGNGTAADFSGTLKLTTLNIASGGSTTISTGVGSVKMSSANAATNTAWIPIQYAGTTYYVPGYTTNSP